jgi:Icc-related predicted phosphoesterase
VSPLLAVIGDVHAHHPRLERVLERIAAEKVDGILMVGDLACAGKGARTAQSIRRYRRQAREVLEAVARLGLPICYVPGNHDLQGLRFPGNVDGRIETIAGLKITGLGGTNPPERGFPYEWTDDELRARPRLEQEADILISHCPPSETPLDFARGAQRHVGSVAVRERALAMDGALVCGHIHESAGLVQLGECLCMNPGGLGEPFGGARVGFLRGTQSAWIEDLDDGMTTSLARGESPAAENGSG